MTSGERIASPEEVRLTNLDEPLFDGAEATKRDLVSYLEAIGEQLLGELRNRPLSVIRALRGQKPFVQKNVPKYAPPWVRTVKIWAEPSKRQVAYALCNDRPTLLWFANQRAVEYHPTLVRLDPPDHPQTHLVLDIDPPAGAPFNAAVDTPELVRQALTEAGLAGGVKISGAKGVHVVVPVAHRRRPRRSPPRRARSPRGPSASTLRWRRRPTSWRIATARCSSTQPARAGRASSPPTARASGRARRSHSRCPGTNSPASCRPTSRSGPRRR